MKTNLKWLPLVLVATLVIACNNFGRKVPIEGTKGEVYYKGNGVSESDAKKVGSYLKDIAFFSNEKTASVQLTKQADFYTVRFVYDQDYFNKNPAAEASFKQIGYEMSQKLFGNTKVNISLADSMMNDFKTIPYDASVAKQNTSSGSSSSSGDNSGTSSLGSGNGGDNSGNSSNAGSSQTLIGYEHEKIGNIVFYWKDISAADEKVVSEYVVKNGSFRADHEVNIITNKEGDHYIIRFPIGDSYTNLDATLQTELEKVANAIKTNVFANQSFSFIVTDTKLNNLKSWDL